MAKHEVIDRLQSTLQTSDLSKRDPALFQVINQLIIVARDLAKRVEALENP